MEEVRTKGIVIDSTDYKEYDKLLTIFTYDMGVIRAVIKGVKKSTAKSRFAGQLFCFTELILSKRGEYYTVISCDLIESFFEIAYNYEKFVLATDIVKVIKFVSKYQPDSTELFITFVSILNVLLKTDTNLNLVYLKFLGETLKVLGYKHNYNKCDKCQISIENDAYLDLVAGAIVCGNCKTSKCAYIAKNVIHLINRVANSEYVDLETIETADDTALSALKVVQTLFKINCN